jgi:hypothetical protein
MGDKNPKSKQKSQHQKQNKADAATEEKKRVAESKHLPKSTDSKKK